MADETAQANVQAFWNQVLESIDRNAETILAQAEAGKDEYPELASAFNLLAAYVHFLHGTLLGLTPFPPFPGTPPPIDFPREVCRRNHLICDCAHGDTGACRALGAPEPIAEIVNCDELLRLYRAAVERAVRAIQQASGDRPFHIDEGILREIDPEVRTAWMSLVAQRCVAVDYLTFYPQIA